ncbi:putative bifunctional diguanylate cyclase/phosphodiesterase [Ancylobacter mangrovi]|uniref:putative bifunctional diguanylate cyclase/phosphodiesterase n=1 Tax=Ancylobacter mangrovi TaxID=2972472 RepID=UPI002161BC88|nr:EAL domain-containing protein [Ancylobacter mangrovi]MCS0500962.1 EAL domain-containing protein [Ancylobacter mangrovi]
MSALESLKDGFALFDPEDRMVLHNRRFIEIFPFLETLGDLHGLTFTALASVPSGEWSWVDSPEDYVAERMRRHHAATGEPFNIPLENGGWAQVREYRTPDGWIVATWSDISTLKSDEKKLLDAIDSLGEGFVLLDAGDRILLANSHMREMFAAAGVSLRSGRALHEVLEEAERGGFFAEDIPADFVASLMAELREVPARRVEIPLRNGGWMLVSHSHTDDGHTVGVWTELTTQKKREAELIVMREQLRQQTEALAEFASLIARHARHDLLTGLPNRFALEERLGQLLRDRDPREIWLAFIDLDHFKGINDAVGYAAADDLLREVGQFLRGQVRGDDMVARLGGDEFAVILTGLDESEVLRIARRLNSATHGRSFMAGGRSFAVGLSIGLAHSTPALATPSSLLAAADTACYVAKDAGRDRVQVYDLGDPKVNVTQQRLSWAERIQLGLELDRFSLHLQAIVDDHRNVLGYEALIRLIDEDGASCGPGQFLPAARRLGLMGRIDAWVLRHATDLALRLISRGAQQYISVNVGANSLADLAFQRNLIDLLEMYPGVEQALRMEITETEEIDDIGQISAFLSDLRSRGLHIYLDDFGNGYNSFEALKRLPVDGIKIDWTVTRDLLQDPIDEALMRAAISIARSLKLELVAEGVEQEVQLAKLRELGASRYQGFFFHRPAEAEAVLS